VIESKETNRIVEEESNRIAAVAAVRFTGWVKCVRDANNQNGPA
jgi:hypothetical protein